MGGEVVENALSDALGYSTIVTCWYFAALFFRSVRRSEVFMCWGSLGSVLHSRRVATAQWWSSSALRRWRAFSGESALMTFCAGSRVMPRRFCGGRWHGQRMMNRMATAKTEGSSEAYLNGWRAWFGCGRCWRGLYTRDAARRGLGGRATTCVCIA